MNLMMNGDVDIGEDTSENSGGEDIDIGDF